MNENREVSINTYRIPANYAGDSEASVQIMGFNISLVRLLSCVVAIVLAGGLVYGFYYFLYLEYDWGTMIGAWVSISFLLCALCINGINGDSIPGFLKSLFSFRSKKRTLYYNPRIKTEIKPTFDGDGKLSVEEMLPRDKIMLYVKKATDKIEKKERDNLVKEQEKIARYASQLYFEDDEGILEKPVEYMTDKEYKAYKKAKKKEEKQKKKESKKAARKAKR